MKKNMPVKYGDEFAIEMDDPIMTSGVVSRLLGIPVWALKRIDSAGVVSPPRKKSKSRLYSKDELNKLKYIWYLIKEKKVKITGLKVILEIEKKSKRRG